MEELCRTKIEAVEMDNATKISLPTRYRPSACRYGPAVALLPVSKKKKSHVENEHFFNPTNYYIAINFVVKISIPSVRTKVRGKNFLTHRFAFQKLKTIFTHNYYYIFNPKILRLI